MTQLDDVLLRLQAQALERPSMARDEDEAAWERYRLITMAAIAAIVAALVERRITVREFELAMTQQVRQSHAIAYAVGRGGLELLTPEDRAAINTRVDGQLTFLKAWVAALAVGAGGTLLLSAGFSSAMLQARAEMYIEATRASLFEGAGARIGIPRLPAYPGDGSTRCLTRCHCYWRIEQVGDSDWNAYWVDPLLKIGDVANLKKRGHCEHCRRRTVAWSPLEIRGGVVMPFIRAGLFL